MSRRSRLSTWTAPGALALALVLAGAPAAALAQTASKGKGHLRLQGGQWDDSGGKKENRNNADISVLEADALAAGESVAANPLALGKLSEPFIEPEWSLRVMKRDEVVRQFVLKSYAQGLSVARLFPRLPRSHNDIRLAEISQPTSYEERLHIAGEFPNLNQATKDD